MTSNLKQYLRRIKTKYYTMYFPSRGISYTKLCDTKFTSPVLIYSRYSRKVHTGWIKDSWAGVVLVECYNTGLSIRLSKNSIDKKRYRVILL